MIVDIHLEKFAGNIPFVSGLRGRASIRRDSGPPLYDGSVSKAIICHTASYWFFLYRRSLDTKRGHSLSDRRLIRTKDTSSRSARRPGAFYIVSSGI